VTRLEVIFVDDAELRQVCESEPRLYPEEKLKRSVRQIIEDISHTYGDRNLRWFAGMLKAERAFLCFLGEGTFAFAGREYARVDAYRESSGEYVFTTDLDQLLMYLGDRQCRLEEIASVVEHEILHEYQAFTPVTQAGISACTTVREQGCYRLVDPGPGHDECWFSAICHVAGRLGIPWQDLFNRVRQ
jgi:hypothetical protein